MKKRRKPEAIDYDYQHKLSAKEIEWLTNFTRAEYYNDHKSLKKLKKRGRVTKKEKKRLNDMDHARRRDIMSARAASRTDKAVEMVNDLTPETELIIKKS